MELVVKHYSELTADELYDILHTRVLVFVVEQKCPYEEVDGRDRQAYHVFLRDETGIKAYLRVLDRGVSFEEVSIGRVLTTERRRGYGHKILDAGIAAARGKVWRGGHPHRSADLRAQALRGSRLPPGWRGISGGRHPPHPDDLARAERLIHDV